VHALTANAEADGAAPWRDLVREHSPGAEGSFPDLDPSTGDLLAPIPRIGADGVRQAIDAASDALPGWAVTAPAPARRSCTARMAS
jgi:acyl-CoA reductase-like NAD-dependent aldehyde dehydrogenase